MTHHQFAATAAERFLRLLPLALVAVALLTIAKLSYGERYSFGSHWYMSGFAYYKCANFYINQANPKAASIQSRWDTNLDIAYENMAKIDNYTPGAPTVILRRVTGWIGVAVELGALAYSEYRSYNASQIIANINSHFSGLLTDLDDLIRAQTGQCAQAQVNKNNFQNNRTGGVIFEVSYTGRNLWLGFPAATRKTYTYADPVN